MIIDSHPSRNAILREYSKLRFELRTLNDAIAVCRNYNRELEMVERLKQLDSQVVEFAELHAITESEYRQWQKSKAYQAASVGDALARLKKFAGKSD